MAASAPLAAGDRVRRPADLGSYRFPQFSFARFVAARAVRTGALWGVVIGAYVYASAVGYNALAPTRAARQQILDSLAANAGLEALLGATPRIDSVGVFVDWRVLGVWPLVVSLWAILLSTKSLRGEESAGRLELFLAGPTTARAVVVNGLVGLGGGLVAMFSLAVATSAAAAKGAGFTMTVGQALSLAAVPTAAAAIFMAVGAVASQLMPTRARAAGLSAGVFAVTFMVRALGDASPSGHWLVYLSPFGWLEQVRPLGAAGPAWLLAAAALVVALGGVAVVLAERDLGAATIGHKDQVRAHTRALGSALGLAIRLTRGSIAAWLVASVVAGVLYGSFAESAGKAFASSSILDKIGGDLVKHAQHVGSSIYAGVIFLMFMTFVMAYVATAMSSVREQEADGLLDNLVVRSVRRQSWLAGRVLIVTVIACAAGGLAGLGFWLGASTQHSGLGLGALVLAGANAAAPGLALLGVTVLVFGFAPRWTSVVGYGLLAWGFLLEMLGSAVGINHWVMDTSLLHHVALAPVTDPDWRVVVSYVLGGLALALVGGWRFSSRDLVAE